MKSRKQTAHLAIHVSANNNGKSLFTKTIIQPRNTLGQFLSPDVKYLNKVSSTHATFSGEVIRKGTLASPPR